MKLLLDTCVLVWVTVNVKRLPKKVINTIEKAEAVYFSPLSLVELAFKEQKELAGVHGQVVFRFHFVPPPNPSSLARTSPGRSREFRVNNKSWVKGK